MKRVIIDTDTASDDAVALIMALREPEIEVVAITTVCGNVDIETATRNALMSIEYAGTYRPPVYSGASRPMLREPMAASYVHGKDGMGDVGTFREPTKLPEKEDAVSAIIRLIDDGNGDIELCTLGPLTNIGLAISQAPEVMKKVPRITMMAGAAYKGNVSPTAEFNIWADPDAADLVCSFTIPFTMATIEACISCAQITEEEIDYLKGTGDELAAFCVDCNRTTMEKSLRLTGKRSFRLPDPTAVALLLHPEMITESFEAYTRVECAGSHMTYGMTVHDRRGAEQSHFTKKGDAIRRPNSLIVPKMDEKLFKEYMFSLIMGKKEGKA